MTDRIHVLTVHLEQDFRDDDVEEIINAIRMLKGVAEVEPREVTLEDHLARTRVKNELRDKVLEIFKQ